MRSFAVVLVGAVALTTFASPSARSASPPSTLLSPAAFARAVASEDTVTINVHVPDAGALPGTDRWIPFDRIAQLRRTLPASRSARLAVYCLSGRMSAIAARTLHRLGYRRVVELRGGMDAWRASGRRLLAPGIR